MLLLPALFRVSEESKGQEKARVVITSSSAAYGPEEIQYETLKKDAAANTTKAREKMGKLMLYWQSKYVSLCDFCLEVR